MVWYEIWYNKEYDSYALLEAFKDVVLAEDGTYKDEESYIVDYGCWMWNRKYKRLAMAKKRLLNGGYELEEIDIMTKGAKPQIVWEGRLVG